MAGPERRGLRSPWHCCTCGGEAVYLGPSLDPAHPLGRCLVEVGLYRKPAHGGHPVAITMDQEELREVLRTRRAEGVRKAHARHVLVRLVKSCPYCAELRESMLRRSAHGPT